VGLRVLEQVPGEELVVDEAGFDVVEVTPEGALPEGRREGGREGGTKVSVGMRNNTKDTRSSIEQHQNTSPLPPSLPSSTYPCLVLNPSTVVINFESPQYSK